VEWDFYRLATTTLLVEMALFPLRQLSTAGKTQSAKQKLKAVVQYNTCVSSDVMKT